MTIYEYNHPIPEHLPESDKELIRRAYGLHPDCIFGQDKAQTDEAREILTAIERDKWYRRECREDARD